MNCVTCGSVLRPGQTRCSCGQYIDMPVRDFYTRLENQVEKSSKDNFRRGLLIGLGFLLLFLLLDTIMDTVFIARELFLGAILLVAAAAIAFNLWQLVRKFLL